MGIKVGIDFGTSNCGVGIFSDDHVTLLPIDPGNPVPEVLRSILYITREYESFIGQEAIETYYRQNINRQRRFVKELAGEIDYFGADMEYVRDVFVYVDELRPGRLFQYLKTALRKGRPGGFAGTRVFERFYSVADLVQIFLSTLKNRAENILGASITGVVLGRPVKFSELPDLDQKAEDTLRQAALAAGFTEVEFELEPVAAAIFHEQTMVKPQNVLIFDFGGGTLDLAIIRLGDRSNRTVYATGGIDIAGSDFDRAIIQKRLLPHFGLGQISAEPDISELIQAVPDWSTLPELATPQNRNLLTKAIQHGNAPVQLSALRSLIFDDLTFSFYNKVESAKIVLSNMNAAVIDLEDRHVSIWELYTRSQFENDISDLKEKIQQALLDLLASSGLEFGQVDSVVKTGGSSNIPLFSTMLEQLFGAERVIGSNAFSSVTAGLAIRAGRGN